MNGLKARTAKIKSDLDRAETSQRDAEELRTKYETQLADAQKSIQDMVNQAKSDAEKTRTILVADAKSEAERVLEKGRKDLEGDSARIKSELRQEIAELTLSMTEKILKKSADKKLVDDVIKESIQETGGMKK